MMTTALSEATARRATGPVTPEGKARSSQNALRHGLTAKTALLPGEDPDTYKKHCQAFFRRFAHRDEVERQLIQQLADIQWRLLRVPGLETALLENCDIKGLATISLYEQRLLRTFEKTLATLKKLQAEESKENGKEEFVFSNPLDLRTGMWEGTESTGGGSPILAPPVHKTSVETPELVNR